MIGLYGRFFVLETAMNFSVTAFYVAKEYTTVILIFFFKAVFKLNLITGILLGNYFGI